MHNIYRLSSNSYERESDEDKVAPSSIIFVSTEGSVTEIEYLEGLNSNRSMLEMNMLVRVEVLRHFKKDGYSAPQYVIELLEEYLRLRENADDLLDDVPKDIVERYGVGFVTRFLDNPDDLSKKQCKNFLLELRLFGYDYRYRRYLRTYKGKNDRFCVLLDRDAGSHSREEMIKSVEHCVRKRYSCFISNPCFEFWLLLHLSDVKQEYADKMEQIIDNEKVSAQYTYVGKEVSKKAHHGKGHIHFEKNYLPNIDIAVARAKAFESDEIELIDNIGSNLWKLIEMMRE